jgi:hypothetical protein
VAKQKPTFDPWPDSSFSFQRPRQPFNWMPLIVLGILGVGLGISVLLILTA